MLLTWRFQEKTQFPFSATSKEPIAFVGKYNTRDERETDMMPCHWNIFYCTYQIPISDAKDINP